MRRLRRPSTSGSTATRCESCRSDRAAAAAAAVQRRGRPDRRTKPVAAKPKMAHGRGGEPAGAESGSKEAMSDASAAAPNGDREGSGVVKRLWRSLKILIFIFVLYYLVLPQIGGLRSAVDELSGVNPPLLVIGVALEAGAL